jgi:signal transduction histidine kinase/ActR/RegA family two-component response regulator
MARLHILYLEDSPTDADLVRRRLLQDGLDAELRVVRDPNQFSLELRNTRVDLVMSDHAVPGYTGRHALETTRQIQPGVPVMLLSSRVDPTEAAECLNAGAVDYLAKADLWKLSHVIRRIVGAAPVAAPPPMFEHSRDAWESLVAEIQRLSLVRTMPAIIDIVRRAARKLVDADGATFVLRDGDKCHYVDEDAISPLWKGLRFPMETCISGWVMMHRRAAVIHDIYKDDRIPADAYRPTFVKSLAMVPIRTQSPLGAIGTYWARPYHPSLEQVALLSSLADATSLAMENVQLYEGLEQRVQDRTVELQSANRELEAFSYSVSHDLRSPVSAVKGYVEYLLEKNANGYDGETIDVLNRVEGASKQMESLIESLISLAKYTLREVERRPFDLTDLATRVVETIKLKPEYSAVRTSVMPGMRPSADPELVRIVLDNLISNAMKFSRRQAEPHIEVGMTADPNPAYYVRDNGVGFDMSQSKRLFAPFHRLHKATDFPGTGIGLATAQRIVNRHAGQIWADSTPGKGTTFYFTLGPPDTDPKPTA